MHFIVSVMRMFRGKAPMAGFISGSMISLPAAQASTSDFLGAHQTGVWIIIVLMSILTVFSILIAVNMIKRRKIEAELRLSEAKQKGMIANISDVIVILDKKGIMTYVSPNIHTWFEWNSRDLIGKSAWETMHLDDRSRIRYELSDLIENPNIKKHVEYRYRCKNGSFKWVDLTAVNLLDDPVIHGILVNFRDISDRKTYETEQEKLRAQLNRSQKIESIGRLAGGIAHDLNNLLTPIIGYSEMLLLEPSMAEKQKKGLNEILGAGERARNLVRQLLAFSRKQTLEYKPVNLNTALKNFESLLRRTIPEHIAISLILEPEIPTVMADIGQIEQVILNLAINAADAMVNGGRLSIKTAPIFLDESYTRIYHDIEPGAYVMLKFTDTGHGMDKSIQDRIFEPFFSTKGDMGTGLGLSTVYGIVKQHRGSISVSSEKDSGTVFRIFLPASDDPEDVLEQTKSEKNLKESGVTILVVEDNFQVRELTTAMLMRKGYSVFSAESGEKALCILDDHPNEIHLVITDVIMPEMNGRDFFQKASLKHPNLNVLYMSGYTDDVIAEQGILEPGIAFIQKPFTAQGLFEKVEASLGLN